MKTLLVLLLLTASAFAEPGALTGTNGQQPLSTTARQIVSAGNSRQRAAIVRNLDATISIYVGYNSDVSSTTGFLIKAGESLTLNTRAALYGVAASGTPTAGYITEND